MSSSPLLPTLRGRARTVKFFLCSEHGGTSADGFEGGRAAGTFQRAVGDLQGSFRIMRRGPFLQQSRVAEGQDLLDRSPPAEIRLHRADSLRQGRGQGR